MLSSYHRLGLLWGVLGTVGLLIDAIRRLLPIALEPVREGLGPGEAAAYLGSIAFMAYFEGYKGFQKAFAPRVVRRAWAMDRVPAWCVVLAPLYVMGLVHATRRRLIATWCLVTGIVALVVMLRHVEQPWRGAVDAGVVVGLSWGTAAIVGWAIAAARGRMPGIEPDLPGPR